jgi:hypothetical protein
VFDSPPEDTSDGYRPGLDDTIAFATEGSR